MGHAHRSLAVPQPGNVLQTQDIYSQATPAYRRGLEIHPTPRSPSYLDNIRRIPLSSTPSPHAQFAPLRMESGYGQKSQQTIPPLNPMTPLGVLQYAGHQATQIKFEINGSIDKGFFLAENEWTCYRRNYFSCICSFTLHPLYPGQAMQFTPSSGPQTSYPVYGFAMNISAVVADSDTQAIDLVQHTPKRDKGPIAKPEKVRLQPKPAQQQQFTPMGQMAMYGQSDAGLPPARPYDPAFGQGQGSVLTEHTYERIQFKQATANNGKRRAAQQYYHLLVELYADVGGSGNDQYMKIGYRKSAKMIVRGRSPGHYQSERRGSTGNGPSGGPGLGDGYGAGMLGHPFGAGPPLMTNTYGGGYDPRHTQSYNTRHHNELHMEPTLSHEEAKGIDETKAYQYYPTPIYEGEHDQRNPVEVFQHRHRSEPESIVHPTTSGLDHSSKVKSEYDGTLPNAFYPTSSFYSQRCGRFEGKASTAGYYPAMLPPSSTLNMTS